MAALSSESIAVIMNLVMSIFFNQPDEKSKKIHIDRTIESSWSDFIDFSAKNPSTHKTTKGNRPHRIVGWIFLVAFSSALVMMHKTNLGNISKGHTTWKIGSVGWRHVRDNNFYATNSHLTLQYLWVVQLFNK